MCVIQYFIYDRMSELEGTIILMLQADILWNINKHFYFYLRKIYKYIYERLKNSATTGSPFLNFYLSIICLLSKWGGSFCPCFLVASSKTPILLEALTFWRIQDFLSLQFPAHFWPARILCQEPIQASSQITCEENPFLQLLHNRSFSMPIV